MADKIVTTIDGKRVREDDCIYIKSQGHYYEKNVTAFQVNQSNSGKPQWYRFDHPHLVKDEGTEEWVDDRVCKLVGVINDWSQVEGKLEPIWGKTSGTGAHVKWHRYPKDFVKNTDVIIAYIARELNCTPEKAKLKLFFDGNAGIWYDYSSDNVVEDCNLPGEIVLKTAAEKIVIGVKGTKAFEYGWSKNPEAGLQISSANYPVKWVSNEEVAQEMGLKEDIYDGVWKDRPSGKYGKRRYYEFMHNDADLKISIDKSLNTIGEGLPYTFGVEAETSIGYMSPRVMSRFPAKCIRDGSLPETGAEYITDVLAKDYGFNVLEGLINELSRRCKVNENCGFHVHLGNVPCTPEFNVAIYSLCEKIQDEVFSMLPYSRVDHTYNEKYQIRKNYCKPLKRLFYKPTVNKLLSAIEEGMEYSELLENLDDKVNEHVLTALEGETEVAPVKDWKKHYNRETKRHAVNNKYHQAQRYEWFSLVSYTFNPGCHVENRAHSGTLSYRKVMNWVLLNMAICWYAQNKLKESIDPNFTPTLEEIVNFAYPRTGKALNAYILERKEKFNKGVENNADRARVEQSEYDESFKN